MTEDFLMVKIDKEYLEELPYRQLTAIAYACKIEVKRSDNSYTIKNKLYGLVESQKKERLLERQHEEDEKKKITLIKEVPVILETPKQKVNWLYKTILNRKPDEEGLALYSGMLKRKEITYEMLKTQLKDSKKK